MRFVPGSEFSVPGFEFGCSFASGGKFTVNIKIGERPDEGFTFKRC